MWWLGMVVAMVAVVVVTEGAPWVLCAQAMGGEVTQQVTGFVKEDSGGIHICKVGINVISPAEWCMHSVYGWVCIHVCLPHDLLLIHHLLPLLVSGSDLVF